MCNLMRAQGLRHLSLMKVATCTLGIQVKRHLKVLKRFPISPHHHIDLALLQIGLFPNSRFVKIS